MRRSPGRPKEPVSAKLYHKLKQQIIEHSFDNGGKFPSEAKLCNQFCVSRSTIRGVLKRIEDDGLLLRRPGDGSYVTQDGKRAIDEMRETAISATHPGSTGDSMRQLAISSFEYPEANRDLWEKAFGRFHALHPDLKLQAARVTEGDVASLSITSKMPDAFNVNAADLPSLVEKGLLLDLTSVESAINPCPAFRPGILDQCRVDGRLHAVPQELNLGAMYCNSGLLKKANLRIDDSRWDWNTFLRIVKKALQELDDPEIYGMNFLAANTYMLYFNVFRCDRPYLTDNYRNSTRALAMLEWFREVASLKRVLYKRVDDQQNELRKFLAGEMLFYFHGTAINPYLTRFCHFPIAKLRPPREEGGLGHKTVVAWAINAKSKRLLSAWEWLKFVSGKEVQGLIAANGGNICAREIQTANCPYGEGKLDDELNASVYKSLSSCLHDVFEHEIWQPPLNELRNGKATAAEALDAIESNHRTVNALLQPD